MYWYIKALKNYAVFRGRSQRKEYWYFILFSNLIALTIGFLSGKLLYVNLYGILILLPTLAVTVRRLHDTNRSGVWILITLIPIFGLVLFIIFMIEDSQQGANYYGRNPKLNFQEHHTDYDKKYKKTTQAEGHYEDTSRFNKEEFNNNIEDAEWGYVDNPNASIVEDERDKKCEKDKKNDQYEITILISSILTVFISVVILITLCNWPLMAAAIFGVLFSLVIRSIGIIFLQERFT